MPTKPEADILTLDEAAAFVGVHRITMMRHARTLGRKVGRVWRFSRARLLAYIEGRGPALKARRKRK